MTGRWRQAAAATAVAAVVAVAGTGIAAAGGDEDEPRVRDLDFRVRDLEPRVRDLTFRTSSIDNVERVEETPEQTSVTLSADVLFDFDQATLTAEAQSRLDSLAEELNELGAREVTIGGHTDSHGEPDYNQDLSVRRAEAVRDALAGRLDGDFTFEVAGHGETQPVAPNEHEDGSDNPEGRALNRRVEITYPS